MTWSIIARDSATGQFGIAVATKFFAVGARVPHIAAGIGGDRDAGAGQSLLRHRRRQAAARGQAARDIVDDADSRPMPAARAGSCTSWMRSGRIAAHTGKDCVDWCGHIAGHGFSIAGNMLAGAAVLDETAKAYRRQRQRCPSRSG